jgi:hypothetical protein
MVYLLLQISGVNFRPVQMQTKLPPLDEQLSMKHVLAVMAKSSSYYWSSPRRLTSMTVIVAPLLILLPSMEN